MGKIGFFTAVLILCLSIGAGAATVDLTVKPANDNILWVFENIALRSVSEVEVGVAVTDEWTIVGKFAFMSRDNDNALSVVYPGLGARYFFRQSERSALYGFGSFSLGFSKWERWDEEYKAGTFECGLGGAYELSEDFALIAETGVQFFRYLENSDAGYARTNNNIGVRLSF